MMEKPWVPAVWESQREEEGPSNWITAALVPTQLQGFSPCTAAAMQGNARTHARGPRGFSSKGLRALVVLTGAELSGPSMNGTWPAEHGPSSSSSKQPPL